MFHAAIASAYCAILEHDSFEQRCRDLPADAAQALREHRAEQQEKARQQAEAERRHRELIDAILTIQRR